MNDEKTPAWFWIVAGIALIWNLMGAGAYWTDVTMGPDAIRQLPQAQQDLRAATPSWLTGVYAIAVFSGLAAAIALCVKQMAAIPLFAVSLVAVVVQMGYVFLGMGAADVLGPQAMVFPGIIIVLGAFLLWFSIKSRGRGFIS